MDNLNPLIGCTGKETASLLIKKQIQILNRIIRKQEKNPN